MMSSRDGEQIEQRYRELRAEIARLKSENERLQDAVQDVLCSFAKLDTATMSKLRAVSGPAAIRMKSPAEVDCMQAEIERLQRELNRAHRIAGKADRMYDAIRGGATFLLAGENVPEIVGILSGTADQYDLALSDPAAEAADTPVLCRRCQNEIDSGHDRG